MESQIADLEKALHEGRIFEAHNLASVLIQKESRNLRLVQLLALSLARLDQPEQALRIIEEFYLQGYRDPETSGILGRIYKDLFIRTNDNEYLEKAINIYYSGFEQSQDYYPGVNAATLLLLAGDQAKSSELAEKILKLIDEPNDYWSFATLGEVHLLRRDYEQAKKCYQTSMKLGTGKFGNLRSTRNQIKLLSQYVEIPESILDLFPQPRIAFFSGHMIDTPDREEPRFPEKLTSEIGKEIDRLTDDLSIDIGFSSIACGADILFIESLMRRKADVRVYLPFKKEDFLKTSVAFAGDIWVRKFEEIMASFTPKYITEEPYFENPELFKHLGKVMMGECMLQADHYDVTPYFITVFSNTEELKTGGTGDILSFWPYPETIHNIDPSKYLTENPKRSENEDFLPIHPAPISIDGEIQNRVSNILFADIVGFSKIAEINTPHFVHIILKQIAGFIGKFDEQLEVINTWGDALVITHPSVETLVKIAIELQKLFKSNTWEELGFPREMNIRIALHSGPAFFARDPLTKMPNVYGSTINRTARMEPVTLPGSIYASDQFASLLKMETRNKYTYQHMGIIDLPKNFGTQEIYMITENQEIGE